MRYTEYPFVLDHAYDFIRLLTSSVFLAPFRFIIELSKKIMYFPKEVIQKICGTAIGVNILLTLTGLLYRWKKKDLLFLTSNIPLICYIISAVFLIGIYCLILRLRQPKLNYTAKYNKPKETVKRYNMKPKKRLDESLIRDNSLNEVDLEEDFEVEDSPLDIPAFVDEGDNDSIETLNLYSQLDESYNHMDDNEEQDMVMANILNNTSLFKDTDKDILAKTEEAYRTNKYGINPGNPLENITHEIPNSEELSDDLMDIDGFDFNLNLDDVTTVGI